MPRLQLHAIPLDDAESLDLFPSWGRPSRRATAGKTERREARAWTQDEDRRSARRELKLRSIHHDGRR